MRKVRNKWLSPAGEETDGSRLALIREGDEAARSRPLWQSHAKGHAVDLLGVKLGHVPHKMAGLSSRLLQLYL
jgi:hypothetical protein